MFEAITAFNLLEHLGAVVFADLPRKMGYSRQISATRQPSPTADGFICIAPYNDDRWMRFFDVVERPDIPADERFDTLEKRQRNREALYATVSQITPGRTTREWLDLMKAADIPAKQVNNLGDLFDDPQLVATDFFREKEHPTEGRYYEVRPIVKYGARPRGDLGFAPHVGEHNAELEAELGFAPTPAAG
jgi:crotonobetainyl-CoA:carnitine CoA-transferase CaiB-like acyl-CoA transferase